ncbi:MAG: hypothetical protein ACE5KE_05815 [Methanosarcinales archaeon]
MNKKQKIVIEIVLLSILLIVLFPPYVVLAKWENGNVSIEDKGWIFIGAIPSKMWRSTSVNIFFKIKFDILALEMIAIIALGTFLFVLFRKEE